MLRCRIIRAIAAAACSFVVMSAAPLRALGHDHQPWGMDVPGRMVALARLAAVRPASVSVVEASQIALAKLQAIIDRFECNAYSNDASARSVLPPLTDHDRGPVLAVERAALSCVYDPVRELIPVQVSSWKRVCSQVHWTCDVIWIPDADPTIWYVHRLEDLPLK